MASRPLPHTLGHVQCPACEAIRIESMRTSDLKNLTFDEAAKLWLIDRSIDVAPRTHVDHVDFADRLGRFFGEMKLKDIHIGHIKAYQIARQGKDPTLDLGKAGPGLINHEIGAVLAKMLEKAHLWKPISDAHRDDYPYPGLYYRALKVPKSTRGRAISAEEEERLKMVAASNPRWLAAYLGTLLTLNTSAGPGEIQHIRVKWINMRTRVVSIREGLKTEGRMREFPMTGTIHWICTQLLKRYYKLCQRHGIEHNEEHYALMGRRGSNGSYDPWKPMGSWKTAWASLTEKAGLTGLRMYDMRHQIQTKLMEDRDITPHTIIDITGSELREPYRHIRNDAKLAALERIESKPAPKIVEIEDKIVEIPVISQKRRETGAQK